jgi:hypothetical protein
VFENRVLRKIYGPKKGEVTDDWRSFILPTKYYSSDKIKKNEMGWACGTFEGEESCTEGFCGKI